MPTRTLRPSSRPAHSRVESRSLWARGNANFLINDPDGYPSEYGPVYWFGSDQWNAGPIGPHGPFYVDVIPAVTRLVAVIVDPLASVPWKRVEQGFGGDVLTTPRWITDPQLLRPDGRSTQGLTEAQTSLIPAVKRSPRTAVYGTWIRSAVLFGTGFLIFSPDAEGQPKPGTIFAMEPWLVTPARVSNGNGGEMLVWELSVDNGTIQTDREGFFELGGLQWRVLCLRDPHAPVDEDGRTISVLERHPATFHTASAMEAYTTGTFTNDGVPSGFLKVNTPGLQQTQANELKAAWMAAHSGWGRSVAVLNATTDYTPVSRSPLDTALVENKRANLADLCMAFSLDPNGALGISMGNSATYGNVGQYFTRLKTDLMAWVESLEQVVSSLLPAGQGIRLDFTELTRPDPKTHYEALKLAVEAGLLTLDEARNTLGLPPLPEPPPAPEPVPVPVPPEPTPEPAPEPSQRAFWPPALRRTP